MQIYSVNGSFYENYDLAVLNAIGTDFMIKSHELVEGYEIDIETSDSNRELTFIDESGKEYVIEFELSFENCGDEDTGGCYVDYTIESIHIEGAELKSTNISQKFKDEILSEIESIAYQEVENINR